MMKIGRLSFGVRFAKTKDFKWFYCPLLKETRKNDFYFFWWFGRRWYVALGRRREQEWKKRELESESSDR